MTTPLKADASPTKAFFVRMLTRDITLDDCILDLVDNSTDGAWESTGANPSEITSDTTLAAFSIDITIEPELFRIADNCGGIHLVDAQNYAFTFGRKEDEPPSDFTVGVYGIGMKRAVFKLGNSISVESTYEAEGQLAAFRVPIQVDQWARDNTEDWDFEIEEIAPGSSAGVTIEVRDLSAETRQKFDDPTFARLLRQTLGRDYLIPLMRGLRITVNGAPVTSQPLLLQEGGDFAPMRHVYEDEDVTIEIVAGMAAAPPDDSDPESQARPDRVSGWYIVCNGRVVLAADRTSVTGWGSAWQQQWHPQYNGFVGIVLFSAVDATKLPMTTTKRSVDTSSAVYARALVQMAAPARAWITYTNQRKAEREQAVERERLSKPTPLANVRPREQVSLPNLSGGERKPRERVANVNYSVPLKRMHALAAALGGINLPYREVGAKSFDYAYESLVDEADE
ncbi:MAG: ATP-binding protein [Actinobacteria bacterium]|nr:ATP-binding protein [Actinomycetota bacterium]